MAIAPSLSVPMRLPERHRWTSEQFETIAGMGLFTPEARLELIDGDFVIREEPMKTPHATGVRRSEIACNRVFVQGHDVRCQLPMALDSTNEPLPDIAVVIGSFEDYEEHHPTTAVLIIEVSDTTLHFDQTTKASLYASKGIADYWILNVADRYLEVCRNPAPAPNTPFEYDYTHRTRYRDGEEVAPLAAPQNPIAVRDLLPRAPQEEPTTSANA